MLTHAGIEKCCRGCTGGYPELALAFMAKVQTGCPTTAHTHARARAHTYTHTHARAHTD